MKPSKMRPVAGGGGVEDEIREGFLRAIALFSGTRSGFIIRGSGWTRPSTTMGKLKEHYERTREAQAVLFTLSLAMWPPWANCLISQSCELICKTMGLARILFQGSSSFHGLVPKGNILSEVDPSYSFLLSQRWRNWGINGGLRGMERRDPGKS